jgi:hypothetical protein
VYTGTTIWLSRRSGRYLFAFVHNVRDASGQAVGTHCIIREDVVQAAALTPGDLFMFTARHVPGTDDTHEFTDVTQVTWVGTPAA